MIEACSFGSMRISGQTYTSDLKIFSDGRVVDAWWRSSGHRLGWEDINDLIEAEPDVIVVGTGIYGRMKADKALEGKLAQAGIRIQTAWTKKAAALFNEMRQKQVAVAGCFHLTC